MNAEMEDDTPSPEGPGVAGADTQRTNEPSPAQGQPQTTTNDASNAPGQLPLSAAAVPPPKPTVDAHGRTLNPRSCVTCRKRKVKCDKTHPCANCSRAHIECIFPAPGRAPRKVRKVEGGRDKELLDRLRRLEGVVKNLGVEVPGDAETADSGKDAGSTPSSAAAADPRPRAASGDATKSLANGTPEAAEPKRRWTAGAPGSQEMDFAQKSQWVDADTRGRFENRFGRLVVNEGKSRYINNSFWANLSNEVEDLKGILNQSSDDDETELSSNMHVPGSHQGFVFGFSSQNVDMLSLHPLPQQVPLYWKTFKENVDPLVKVLHIPTIEPTIHRAASHLSNLSRGFEALMFAIYYGAVTSLSAQDCHARFGEEKPLLLARYRFAIEQALARANFLITEEIIVLQALVVFLICLRRNNDARVIWTLTGLVVRIAQTIGIHRDGSHFGLMPFECEMRRRLWWQVCILDTRASEDHGCDPTIIEQAFDTKLPMNINDIDITPDMKDYPPERQGCTDLSFCLIRFEVANTFRRINYIPPGPPRMCCDHFSNLTLQDKEKWITECHKRLEERYLTNCDMTVPLYWVTATVARLMMSKMWLMVYHPFQRQDGGASLPVETKDKLFITSLENIEYSLLLETESRTMKWGWLFKTYMQWHALAFLLSELCHRTTGDLVERSWIAVEKTRKGRWEDQVSEDDLRGHLWRPLKKLYRKAREARNRGLQEEELVKLRSSGAAPKRNYSPNANPMFGHPKRPTVVRAPLSQAQLQRFTEGPAYGQRPLDSHELLKSPRLPEIPENGEGEVDPMDIAQPADLPVGTTHILSPRAQKSQVNFGGQQPFPQMQPVDFGTTDLLPQQNHNRMTSLESNFDPLLDGMEMENTTGDLNWENWDQLVRQWGMDVDAGPAGAAGWEMGGGSWDVNGNGNGFGAGGGGIGGGPGQSASMGGAAMGMGMNMW